MGSTLQGSPIMSQAGIARMLDRITHAFHEGDPEAGRKQAEAENVRLLREQYDAIARGDFDGAIEMFAEDIEFEILGPERGPFAGRWQGRAEVGDAVRRNFAKVENQEPEIHAVVAQGDTVVIIARECGRIRDTGQHYDVHWVQQFTFRDGKAVRIREIFNGGF
jgi:ketosteroid isomerase-like protein